MAVLQITARVTAQTKGDFELYAALFRLTASELLNLLIVRERQRRQLIAIGPQLIPRQPRGSARLPTVTAHLSSIDQLEEFDRYAEADCQMSRGRVAAWLIENELRERWLERAITTL